MQFDLKDYENRQFVNKIQLAGFGLIIALVVIYLFVLKKQKQVKED